jgi:hypothetical protein
MELFPVPFIGKTSDIVAKGFQAAFGKGHDDMLAESAKSEVPTDRALLRDDS